MVSRNKWDEDMGIEKLKPMALVLYEEIEDSIRCLRLGNVGAIDFSLP
jgi:hypothetical protein